MQNQYLNHSVDQIFQGVNRFFVLYFENENGRISYPEYYLAKLEIRDYNANTYSNNFFDHPINNDIKTYENIRKTATCQGDDYTTGCLLDYLYLRKIKNIAIDLSKQQALDADPRAV